MSWFKALLRQDTAFFDVKNVAGLSGVMGPTAVRYQRGVGPRFGEGIQNITTALGGLTYAFYSNWKTTLVVMAVMPFIVISAMVVMKLNQAQTNRTNKAYTKAAGISSMSVSQIRTILSLNAVSKVIDLYSDATQEAYEIISGGFFKQGLANGALGASFTIMQGVLALYGGYLIYTEVGQVGCNPAGQSGDPDTCYDSGASIFGSVLGVTFAAKGASALGNFMSTFQDARSATFLALQSINRTEGAKEQKIYEDQANNVNEDEMDLEQPAKLLAILPQYLIDASSNKGFKPQNVEGRIHFKDVKFSYPTRPGEQVLNGLTLDVKPGQTVALVGPSGGGKSTTVSLLERFYDVTSGSLELDGDDIRKINVSHLRSLIGYVGQEPHLFATTIAGNIRYGNPSATQEQIEEAARMANAHDFISSFPQGYDTPVGDTCQLSGGQKQRICIARVLVANPKILILDEATSALDTQSEKIVQRALDSLIAEGKRTTFIIAHRLTTVRSCDQIAVIAGGKVVEKGTHDELMSSDSTTATGHYRNLVQKQQRGDAAPPVLPAVDENNSTDKMSEPLETQVESTEAPMVSVSLNDDDAIVDESSIPHFCFKDCDFAYPSRAEKKIFDGLNLSIRQGETLALVGPSGGGKSTVVSLLERFYDPTAGTLEYMGQNVKDLNLSWYRDQIGLVGQEPLLFEDTIANNISYGCAPGTVTRVQIEEAAKAANAYDFIMSFKDGFDTMIGEGSTGVSGGQKQRLAIARALVKKPQVLLLDEGKGKTVLNILFGSLSVFNHTLLILFYFWRSNLCIG